MSTLRRADQAESPRPAQAGGLRVALYSHDTVGLGHLRRNISIADSLAASDLQASSLLIAGAHEANFFRLPERADLFTLPRWQKNRLGDYDSGKLDLSQGDLASLRAQSICAALEVFRPDLFIVDKVPRGIAGELLPALEMLRRRGGTTTVLGLRDVLDEPSVVQRQWLTPQNVEAIDALFDAVWVYGDPRVYDMQHIYQLPPQIASKLTYTGYIHRRPALDKVDQATADWLHRIAAGRNIVACMVGGGEDGGPLAHAFAEAHFPEQTVAVIVTGPFMPSDEKRDLMARAARRENMYVVDFLAEADLLIERADQVVAMGGYNTVCSLVARQKNALLVPRVVPRSEQYIRARRLEQLGLVDVLQPENLSPEALSRWIAGRRAGPSVDREPINLDGLKNIRRLTHGLVSRTAAAGR